MNKTFLSALIYDLGESLSGKKRGSALSFVKRLPDDIDSPEVSAHSSRCCSFSWSGDSRELHVLVGQNRVDYSAEIDGVSYEDSVNLRQGDLGTLFSLMRKVDE
jgi:hypothetical protein|tara:strand:- start:700 stop:1011 length:312 start_codon:yes stop_codon:yes gene_type:complete